VEYGHGKHTHNVYENEADNDLPKNGHIEIAAVRRRLCPVVRAVERIAVVGYVERQTQDRTLGEGKSSDNEHSLPQRNVLVLRVRPGDYEVRVDEKEQGDNDTDDGREEPVDAGAQGQAEHKAHKHEEDKKGDRILAAPLRKRGEDKTKHRAPLSELNIGANREENWSVKRTWNMDGSVAFIFHLALTDQRQKPDLLGSYTSSSN
jgi:hypothetical protein